MVSFKRLLSIVILFVQTMPIAFAGRELPFENSVYQALIQNFQSEVAQFDGFQTEDGLAREVKAYLASWRTWFEEGAQGVAPALTYKGKHWEFNLTSATNSAPVAQLPGNIDALHVPFPIDESNSSMENVEGFVRERVGSAAFLLMKSGKVDPVVYGGTFQSWKKNLLGASEVAYTIPSPYEAWSIQKVLVLSQTARPKLVYIIPPIRQYVFHHLAMFQIADAPHPLAYLNSFDRHAYKKSFKDDYERIPDEMKARIKDGWLVLGYQSTFFEKLGSQLVSSVDLGSLHLKQYRLSTGQYVLSIGSDATLWGEGTSFLVAPFLKMEPAGVLFFGSAGYFLRDLNVYDVHSPELFRLDDLKGIEAPIEDDFTQESGTHISTFSPLAETKERVESWIKSGVTSVDVEQSLLANLVGVHNSLNRAHIKFGAINLITDFPASQSYPADPNFNLDHVNPELKAKARHQIVDEALAYFEKNDPHFCETKMGGDEI